MSSPLVFTLTPSKNDDRLDCAWHNPVSNRQIAALKHRAGTTRALVRLDGVANVTGGKRLPEGTVVGESDENTILYVRARDVKNLKVNLGNAQHISKAIHKVIQNYQLRKDDVVITIVGVNIGVVGILEDEVDVCDFTENLSKVRVYDPLVLPKFILYYLDSNFGAVQMEKYKVGALQDKLSLGSCRGMGVYIPQTSGSYDHAEQQRIVDEVDGLFDKAELHLKERYSLAAKARSVVTEKLKVSTPAPNKHKPFIRTLTENEDGRLDALFNNPFREQFINALKRHPYQTLGELSISQATLQLNPSDFYRLVDLEQIDELTGRIQYAKDVADLGSDKIVLQRNCILIAKMQPEKGKIALVTSGFEGAAASSELIQLKLISSDLSLDYLWAVLRSDYVLHQWEYLLTGSSRMRIGATELANTIIPIPDRALQDEIVKGIRKLLTQSDTELSKATQFQEQARKRFTDLLLA